MNRVLVELNLGELIEKAIEETIVRGLNDDKEEIISDYNKDTFCAMQNEYRMYGALFGMNFKKNLEEMLEEKVKEEK